jgi:hypothetical protein
MKVEFEAKIVVDKKAALEAVRQILYKTSKEKQPCLPQHCTGEHLRTTRSA